MSLIVELTTRPDPLLFQATFDRVPDAECLFEDVHYVTDDDGRAHYVLFWWVSGCEFEAFERALAADDTVSDFHAVTKLPERAIYRVESMSFPSEKSLLYTQFREHDVTPIESRRDAAGLNVRARFPSREALHDFLEADADVVSRIEVTRLYVESSVSGQECALTTKQREALATALERGYFETPSQVTLAELADEFDVTPQTLSRHIRVGVRKVVSEVLGSPVGVESGTTFKDTSA